MSRKVTARAGNVSTAQDSLHELLLSCINRGYATRIEYVLSLVLPWLVNAALALKIKRLYCRFDALVTSEPADGITVRIDSYAGNNAAALEMGSYLQRNLRNDLAGAYVHGSIGKCEEIPYSDFDALVIIKTEVFFSVARTFSVVRKLRKALGIMYRFDPLQHHGWFVLTEADLCHYNEGYFHHVLFSTARSLFAHKGRTLRLSSGRSGSVTRSVFREVAESTLTRLDRGDYQCDSYQLKSLLSEFMLLPALYMQDCRGKTVSKKDSYQAAEDCLHTEYWESMRNASSIREHWVCALSPWRRWLMTRVHPLRRYLVRLAAPPVPHSISARLTQHMIAQMKHLVRLMLEKCGSSDWEVR